MKHTQKSLLIETCFASFLIIILAILEDYSKFPSTAAGLLAVEAIVIVVPRKKSPSSS